MTLGGNCDTSTCKTGYWSGATLNDDTQSSLFMTKSAGSFSGLIALFLLFPSFPNIYIYAPFISNAVVLLAIATKM